MRKFIKILIITVSLMTLKGCNESRILEENTKEIGLSNYKVNYKYLNADYFKEGYLFEPLYFKDDELYGITNFYPIQGTVEVEDNLLYKIDKNGNFKEYENETITNYLEDWQIKDRIEDKNIYIRGMHTEDNNNYYSDFENNTLRELEWLKETMKSIETIEKKLKESYSEHLSSAIYKYNNIELHEVTTMNYKESNGTKVAYKDNYKFIYCIDFDKEELYISDILKEEESLAYYYNESLEKFIKINNNGVFEELDLVSNKIEIKENKKEDFKINANYKFNYNFKDFTAISYKNRNEETNEPEATQTMVINNKDNSYKIYYENKDEMNDYIEVSNEIKNSNYFIALYNYKYYIASIEDNLDLELIREIDLNYDIYEDTDSISRDIFSNEEGTKALITIAKKNWDKDDIYFFDKIQYIYLDIEEKE